MTIARRTVPFVLLLLLTACGAPGGGVPVQSAQLQPACAGAAPFPSSVHLDPFYTKYCMAGALPIVASAEVPDAALQRAKVIVTSMLTMIPSDAIAAIADNHVRIGVIGVNQVTTDMPEYADLNTAFPGTDWNTRTRGVSATVTRPLTSSAEENLLCYPGDVYAGESILVHEFAHTIAELGLEAVDATFATRLQTTYDNAMSAGLWPGSYSATNRKEYWAEGVQSYFGVSNNGVDSRAALMAYDKGLYDLIDGVFAGSPAISTCP